MAPCLARLALVVPILLCGPNRSLGAVEPRDASARVTLRLLHDGRFDEAEESLGRAGAAVDDPATSFLSAFVTYWRLLYDDQNPGLVRTFDERLERAVDVAARAAKGTGRAAGSRLWGGYAHLLLAQLRASQKRPILAAREARAGRRMLEDARVSDPASAQPLFGLGTYNYYADRMSALAKGLRFLLGLPAGDRELGLEQLDRSARDGSLFALESRIVLATIYSSRHEGLYELAERQAELALSADAEAVTLLDAAARLNLSLGNPVLARRRLERALALAQAAPRTDPSVLAALRYQRSRAEFALFRPDRAAEILSALPPPDGLPARLRSESAALAASAARLLEGGARNLSLPDGLWTKLLPALELERGGDLQRSLAELRSLFERMPDEPLVALFVGRALLLEGRAAEALFSLERASASEAIPEPWQGPCRLLAGRAADLAFRRELAVDFYRAALKAPPFIEIDAARFHQRVPYRGAS